MASQQQVDLDAAIANIGTGIASVLSGTSTLITEMTNAFSRLLAKIEAGNNLQPTIDQLVPLVQQLTDVKAQIDGAIAQAQVEGN